MASKAVRMACALSALPPALVLRHVLPCLEPRDIALLARVSRDHLAFAREPALWRAMVHRKFEAADVTPTLWDFAALSATELRALFVGDGLGAVLSAAESKTASNTRVPVSVRATPLHSAAAACACDAHSGALAALAAAVKPLVSAATAASGTSASSPAAAAVTPVPWRAVYQRCAEFGADSRNSFFNVDLDAPSSPATDKHVALPPAVVPSWIVAREISGGTAAHDPAAPGYHVMRLVLIGEPNSGKTSLCSRIGLNSFGVWNTSIGVDFRVTRHILSPSQFPDWPLVARRLRLQTWDTPGFDRFPNAMPRIYRAVNAVMFTVDPYATDRSVSTADAIKAEAESRFTELTRIYDHFLKGGPPGEVTTPADQRVMMLVATKSDLSGNPKVPRVVSEAALRAWAAARGMMYAELSAMSGRGVTSAVRRVVVAVMKSPLVSALFEARKFLEFNSKLPPPPPTGEPSKSWCSVQ